MLQESPEVQDWINVNNAIIFHVGRIIKVQDQMNNLHERVQNSVYDVYYFDHDKSTVVINMITLQRNDIKILSDIDFENFKVKNSSHFI